MITDKEIYRKISECHEIMIFGYGRQGKKAYKSLSKDFKVVKVFDNKAIEKREEVDGIIVEIFDDTALRPIIVTASEHNYIEIQKQLEQIGLVEYKDFVAYFDFISEWNYLYREKVCIPKTDLVVTPKCTLKCKNCIMFSPYWIEKKDFSIEDVKHSVDTYFKWVDFVYDMDILGGEPLLYSEIGEIIEYIGEKYKNKIGYLGIITNGTILPNEYVTKMIKKYNVCVSISDYSNIIPYAKKIEELIAHLEKNQINYFRNRNIEWYDFGFPSKPYHYNKEDAELHMKRCNTICHLLEDGKLFYCGTAWAASKAGLFTNDIKNCLDLENVADADKEYKERIIEFCSGIIPDGYIEFCRVCGGFGVDNENMVEAAKQL